MNVPPRKACPGARQPGTLALGGILVAAILAAVPVLAQDWEYRVLPGDTLWDVSARYLASAEQTPALQEYNRIDNPWRLRPGSTLRVPVAWLRESPAPAEVAEASGAVRARVAASEPEISVSPGQRLWAGSVLETGAGASATVVFADGSRLLVAGDTRLVFDKVSTYGGTGMADTRMRLLHGRVESRVRSATGPASRFTIDTPPATSTVRGTQLRVATDPAADRTIAEVTEGVVDVESRDRRYTLRQGFGLAIDAQGHPSRPQALLPAPAVGALDDRPWRVGQVIEWPPLPGAQAYRLQLAGESESGVILADEVVSAPRAPLPTAGEGRYVLRVRAIDADGIEGHDAVRPVTLHDRPEPPFVIEPGLDDRLSPGRVRFRWTASESATTYRLQLARNDDFTDKLLDLDARGRTTLRTPHALDAGRYFWRVAGRDDAGRMGEFSDMQSFEIRTGPAGPAAAQTDRTTVRWQAGAPGHRYHVQVAAQPDFDKLITEVTLAQPEIRLNALPGGRFYMRIREIDADGYSGPFGPAQLIDTRCMLCRAGTVATAILVILLL